MKKIYHLLSTIVIPLFTILLAACNNKPVDDSFDISMAQSQFAEYNHTALVVSNLDTSVAFYQGVFQFDTIPYPFPPRKGIEATWLKIGENVELHLAEFEGDTPKNFNPGHLGFMVSSIDTLLTRLFEVSSAYKQGKEKRPVIDEMPYGARTLMIKDPDGYDIHIIESIK